MHDFPNKLKELRIEHSLTQTALADKLNVTQNAIFNWENGKREPSLEMIMQISTLFNVSPSYLMGYSTKMIKPTNSLLGEVEKLTYIKTPNRKLEQLAIHFSQLNNTGQEKAVEQVEMLTKISEYRKDCD